MNEVTTFLRSLSQDDQKTTLILLASRQNDDRTSVDGIILFDRATSQPVISIGGKWFPFTLGVPLP
jgi:hypothetical protein